MLSIINQIINKFQSEYTASLLSLVELRTPAIASNKRDAFWNRYCTDEAFKNKTNNSYACMKHDIFDFWLPPGELREYLKPELQSAELLLIKKNKVSALEISDVSSALEIAENIEKFRQLVTDKQAYKTNIWFELERRLLNETRI